MALLHVQEHEQQDEEQEQPGQQERQREHEAVVEGLLGESRWLLNQECKGLLGCQVLKGMALQGLQQKRSGETLCLGLLHESQGVLVPKPWICLALRLGHSHPFQKWHGLQGHPHVLFHSLLQPLCHQGQAQRPEIGFPSQTFQTGEEDHVPQHGCDLP